MLATLINSAVEDIVKEYSTTGHSIQSIQSTEPGPFDAPHLASPALAKAIQTIEAACAQLTFTVANPGHVITNVSYCHPAGRFTCSNLCRKPTQYVADSENICFVHFMTSSST